MEVTGTGALRAHTTGVVITAGTGWLRLIAGAARHAVRRGPVATDEVAVLARPFVARAIRGTASTEDPASSTIRRSAGLGRNELATAHTLVVRGTRTVGAARTRCGAAGRGLTHRTAHDATCQQAARFATQRTTGREAARHIGRRRAEAGLQAAAVLMPSAHGTAGLGAFLAACRRAAGTGGRRQLTGRRKALRGIALIRAPGDIAACVGQNFAGGADAAGAFREGLGNRAHAGATTGLASFEGTDQAVVLAGVDAAVRRTAGPLRLRQFAEVRGTAASYGGPDAAVHGALAFGRCIALTIRAAGTGRRGIRADVCGAAALSYFEATHETGVARHLETSDAGTASALCAPNATNIFAAAVAFKKGFTKAGAAVLDRIATPAERLAAGATWRKVSAAGNLIARNAPDEAAETGRFRAVVASEEATTRALSSGQRTGQQGDAGHGCPVSPLEEADDHVVVCAFASRATGRIRVVRQGYRQHQKC